MSARMAGKVALVTGAARGIGESVARALAAAGARVLVTDIDAGGSSVAASIGPGAAFELLDVREERDWERAMGRVGAWAGGLHVLVNNAGISGLAEPGAGPQDPERCSLEDWRRVHATNLEGVFLGCKHGIPLMRRSGGGSIINISSRSGMVGVAAAAPYASSKAGVRNHTKSVALWCAQNGDRIRCNSVHPGAVMTPMWEPMLGPGPERESTLAELRREVPLRRMGRPEEVAALVVFLASDESAYITGAEFTIDGGILAGSVASPPGER